MAFRGILPEVPSFGAQLAKELGGGIGKGVEQAGNLLTQSALEKMKLAQRKKLIDSVEGGRTTQRPSISEEDFISALPQIEQTLGRDLTPQDVSQLWEGLQGQQSQTEGSDQEDPFRKAKQYAALGEHDLSRVEADKAKLASKQSFARETAAEPKLEELNDRLRSLEATGMRFERLQNLFSPELEKKFPPTFAIGMFTKNGELTPLASSQLSPEAQESVKLISDELSGAKDTFGARVTNFDLQSYMKRLPTLLNTAEGRRRVLRDLRLMNEINQTHDEGILNIIDRYGGAGKISISKAERIFKKEFAPKMKEFREEFANPEKSTFNELPSASRFPGRKIEDENGKIFVSDGKEWVIQD